MNCEEAEELLGAYAVDALSADEAARFRAHVATCEEHRAKAAELRAVASTLAATADAPPPPPALRARVLDAIAREPQQTVISASAPRAIGTAPRARAVERRVQWGPLRNFRPARTWGALAAAIIAGLLVWNVVLQSRGEGGLDASDADSAVALMTADKQSVGTVLLFNDKKRAIVIAQGVGALDASKTYQMWAVNGGDAVSLGTMRPGSDGRASSEVALDASTVRAFAITVEPAGGSPQPTSEPVLTAELRS